MMGDCGPAGTGLAEVNQLDELCEITHILVRRFAMPTSNPKSSRGGGTRKPTTRPVATPASAFLIETGGPPHKGKSLAIPVRSKTLKALAGQPGQMGALIETYGAAVEKSRLMGRSVSFVVDVGPRGEPKFRQVEDTPPQASRPATGEHEGDLQAALAAARERGRGRVADILSGKEMLSADEFALLIGTSRVTVNAKRQSHQVLGLEGAKRGFRFPEWQVGDDGKPFAALPELFDRLGGSPWAVYRFLVQHHPELNGLSGREALARGRSAEVMEVAESVLRAAS